MAKYKYSNIRIGTRGFVPDEETKTRRLELLNQDLSLAEIARHEKTTRQGISIYFKRHGITVN